MSSDMIPKFDIEDIVYFKLDKDQNPMILLTYWVKKDGISYECKDCFGNAKYYFDFELSTEQNILTKVK